LKTTQKSEQRSLLKCEKKEKSCLASDFCA